MSKILIVYGSSTGNTESIAEAIAKILGDKGHEVTIRNAAEVSAEGLAQGYDAVLFGSSVWGIDEVEFQDDFAPLVDEFGSMGLSGGKVAAFASGDSSYENFCGAVDVLESKAKEVGATLIAEGLRVEGDASAAPEDIKGGGLWIACCGPCGSGGPAVRTGRFKTVSAFLSFSEGEAASLENKNSKQVLSNVR